MRVLPAAIQRFFAVALALLAVWVTWWLMVQWWLVNPLVEIREEEDILNAVHQRYAALNAQRDTVQQRLVALEEKPLPAGSLLVAHSPEAATAQIMQLIVERSMPPANSGVPCTVINRLPQTASAVGTLTRVSVQGELECGIESLAATLYRLENTEPYLRIDAFEIRRTSALIDGQPRLSARLQISGLLDQSKVVTHG